MSDKQPRRRSYHQFCGAARALDVVGERWTLLIVRDLLLGARRYTDLLEVLPGITTNLLAKRLKEMTATGLIRRDPLPGAVRADVYSLTARGAQLEPVLLALARWGNALMDRRHRDDTANPGWALLSLKTIYRGGLELEARVDGRTFELLFLPHELRIQERSATRPAAVVESSISALARVFFGREPLSPLVAQGAISITGDRRALQKAIDATDAPAS